MTMPLDDTEEWRPTHCAPDYYEVSNYGRVRRATYAALPARGPDTAGELLTLYLNPVNRYLYARMRRSPKYSYLVHILVAHAFLEPKPTPEHTVNHIDGTRTNNRASNLEWLTRLEQIDHAILLGRMKRHPSLAERGELNPQVKLTEAIVRVIRYAPTRFSQRDLADLFNVNPSLIGKIRARKNWKHLKD